MNKDGTRFIVSKYGNSYFEIYERNPSSEWLTEMDVDDNDHSLEHGGGHGKMNLNGDMVLTHDAMLTDWLSLHVYEFNGTAWKQPGDNIKINWKDSGNFAMSASGNRIVVYKKDNVTMLRRCDTIAPSKSPSMKPVTTKPSKSPVTSTVKPSKSPVTSTTKPSKSPVTSTMKPASQPTALNSDSSGLSTLALSLIISGVSIFILLIVAFVAYQYWKKKKREERHSRAMDIESEAEDAALMQVVRKSMNEQRRQSEKDINDLMNN